MNQSVFIIILNWNNWLVTVECIKSIFKSSFKNYKIVVIDNNSTDCSVENISRELPDIEIIQSGGNLGYAGGNNVGFKSYLNSDYKFAFVINNDCFVDKECIQKLVNAYSSLSQTVKVGFLGPLVFSGSQESPKISFSGSCWSDDSISYKFLRTAPETELPIDSPVILGCSMFCSFELLREIGLFDERLFLLWEESDICLRAKQKGYSNFCIPTASVWHQSGASFKNLKDKRAALWDYFYRRNQLLWIEKHIDTPAKNKYYFTLLVGGFISSLRMFLSPRSIAKNRLISRARLHAYFDYVTRNFGDCPKWLRKVKDI